MFFVGEISRICWGLILKDVERNGECFLGLEV